MLKIEFVKDKDTKNTVRFKEVEVDGTTQVGLIYIPKTTLDQHNINADQGFTMTIEPIK